MCLNFRSYRIRRGLYLPVTCLFLLLSVLFSQKLKKMVYPSKYSHDHSFIKKLPQSDRNNAVMPYDIYRERIYRKKTQFNRINRLSSLQRKMLVCGGYNLSESWDALSSTDFEMDEVIHNPHFKNPCWREELTTLPRYNYTGRGQEQEIKIHKYDYKMNMYWKKLLPGSNMNISRVRCLPYFFIPGNAKCGTSDLYHTLQKHPEIVGGALKEPNWFRQRMASRARKQNTMSQYIDLFDAAAVDISKHQNKTGFNSLITGDGSINTVHDAQEWPFFPGNEGLSQPDVISAHHLRNILPNVKLIFMVRNPVDRVYSFYNMRNAENGSPEDFHRLVVESLDPMIECLKSRSIRECAYDRCVTKHDKASVHVGLYLVYLRDWLKVFPKEHVRVYTLEDYKRSRMSILNNITDFLGIERYPARWKDKIELADIVNAKPRKPMLQETSQMLTDFYTPFNRMFASLMHDNRFNWL